MMDFTPLLNVLRPRIKPPVLIVLGSPRLVCDLAEQLREFPVANYQFDLHQSNKLEFEAGARGLSLRVEVKPDLWDLPAEFATVIFPVMKHGERELKLDMMEQSIQVLQPGGLFASISEYERDSLIPKWHKKVYGKCSGAPVLNDGSLFWSTKEKDVPRRRHQIDFHARLKEGPSRKFISWPGSFSYGRMDDGARALLDIAEINPEDAVLDLGCGIGTNGILIAHKTTGLIAFVDSNVRSAELTRINAEANGLANFRVVASSTMEGLEPGSFDVVLANPPYYSQSLIAAKFVEASYNLLKPGGRMYLVTKMINEVGLLAARYFPEATFDQTRGYSIIKGIKGEGELPVFDEESAQASEEEVE